MPMYIKYIKRIKNKNKLKNHIKIPFYPILIGDANYNIIINTYYNLSIHNIIVSIKNDGTIFIDGNYGRSYTIFLYITDNESTSIICEQFQNVNPINTSGLYKELVWQYNAGNGPINGRLSTTSNSIVTVSDLKGQIQIKCLLGNYNGWYNTPVNGYIYIEQQ
jgi:hypothetical protein